jgi:hypothetical protein
VRVRVRTSFMYLLAFKNNDEREELYNGAEGGAEFCPKFLVDEARGMNEAKRKTKQKFVSCLFLVVRFANTQCVLSL